MIALSAENGNLIKVFDPASSESYGFHTAYGFISDRASRERQNSRKLHGMKASGAWLCRFKLNAQPGGALTLEPLEGCQVERAPHAWNLMTAFGRFQLSEVAVGAPIRVGKLEQPSDQGVGVLRGLTLVLSALAIALIFFFPQKYEEELPQKIFEPVTVKIVPEVQKAVTIPAPSLTLPKELAEKIQNKQAKRAVEQNLGFLGLLGRKDLKKALGGAPTALKDASPGAGPGGKEGSGGELLVGLGQGVKRVTVGNSGVAGLGGIGTKGAGGGAGGYGNSMVGSGEGRGLSTAPLSQDVILEGGLDKSVINATIAKYLSQVRACYENSLRKVPGLTGQVSMNIEISGSGDVVLSRVSKSTLGNTEAEQCIQQRILTWKFPKPLGGVNVKVNYPFMLRPVSS